MDRSRIKTIAERSREEARSQCVRADLLDEIIVNCRIKPRREAMHCSRTGKAFIKNGVMGVIPFGERVFLPANEFNTIVLTEDSMSDQDQNPMSYDVVEFGFLRDGKLCSRNGLFIDKDGSIIESENEENKNELPKYWIVESDDLFKVTTLDKNEKEHVLKKFISHEDALKHIESLSITS